MDISGVSASTNVSIPVKVFKQTQELQKDTASKLIESVPAPTATKGQNINIKV